MDSQSIGEIRNPTTIRPLPERARNRWLPIAAVLLPGESAKRKNNHFVRMSCDTVDQSQPIRFFQLLSEFNAGNTLETAAQTPRASQIQRDVFAASERHYIRRKIIA